MRALCTAAALAAAIATAQGPALGAESAIVLDARSGRVLYEREADSPRPPASTTKIATALVVLDRCRMEENVVVSEEAARQTGSSFHLRPGEVLTVRDLLYALMLRSANDAAYALAEHAAGSVALFAEWMNERARKAGCTATNFVNPHGLPAPGHVSTARDLAKLGLAAMADPELAAIAACRRHTVARGAVSKDTLLVNRNRWLEQDPSALGLKTGTTVEAGQCFVGCAQRPGGKVVTALMRSKDWLADQRSIAEWAYQDFAERELAAPGLELARAQVERGAAHSVAVGVARPVVAMARPGEAVRLEGLRPVRAPVRAGDRLGKVQAVLPDGTALPAEAVALESVDLAFLDRFGPGLGTLAGLAAVAAAWRTAARRRTG